ncbi:MAG: hypothetical protein PHV74_13815 [Dehalococcoidia bacterium]|nr:hypothetical protein [Dehalococcoidia bacterium]
MPREFVYDGRSFPDPDSLIGRTSCRQISPEESSRARAAIQTLFEDTGSGKGGVDGIKRS